MQYKNVLIVIQERGLTIVNVVFNVFDEFLQLYNTLNAFRIEIWR